MADLKGQDAREVIESYLGESLDGPLGNAWFLSGRVKQYLKDEAFEPDVIKSLVGNVKDGTYEDLLRRCAEALLET